MGKSTPHRRSFTRAAVRKALADVPRARLHALVLLMEQDAAKPETKFQTELDQWRKEVVQTTPAAADVLDALVDASKLLGEIQKEVTKRLEA